MAYLDPRTAVGGAVPHEAAETGEGGQGWQNVALNVGEQLIAFEADDCGYCRQFDKEVLAVWKNPLPIVSTHLTAPPEGWKLNGELFATPTIVLFRDRQEVARYTGYRGAGDFWRWLSEAGKST